MQPVTEKVKEVASTVVANGKEKVAEVAKAVKEAAASDSDSSDSSDDSDDEKVRSHCSFQTFKSRIFEN